MPSTYNILILGSGGRECTLAWKISQSALVDQLFIAPGNAGTALYGINIKVSESDFLSIKEIVLQQNINLVVVGPEAPLVEGIVDFFHGDPELKSVMILGPGKAGAMLEGSKDFAKGFMKRNGIPTADYQTFTSGEYAEAIDFIRKTNPPYVLKVDGLAAGKGVIICKTAVQAKKELSAILLDQKFGLAGRKVVIEQYLSGIELSVFVLTDGENFLLLPEAKDYKRIREGDTGPNTGGMGAVSPLPFFKGSFKNAVLQQVIIPTIKGLQQEKIPYKGFIFFGLMKVGNQPYVIEYNARLGDPETEVILPRIRNDIVKLLLAAVQGSLDKIKIMKTDQQAACVMMVAPGYPGAYPKGLIIKNLDTVSGVITFHAGTGSDQESRVISTGGRILGLTGLAATLPHALSLAYSACKKITYPKKKFRKDIGKDILSL